MPLVTDYCRITLVLPVNNSDELTAAFRSIEIIRKNYEGITHGVLHPPGFRGYWKKVNEDKTVVWYRDRVSVALVDVPIPIDEVDEITGELLMDTHLKIIEMIVHDEYKRATNEDQVSVWLTAHRLMTT